MEDEEADSHDPMEDEMADSHDLMEDEVAIEMIRDKTPYKAAKNIKDFCN